MGDTLARWTSSPVSRFYIRPEAVSGERVRFDAEETRHLARVLRVREGGVVHALDGRGGGLVVRLTRIGARDAEGEVIRHEPVSADSPLDLTLVQGVPKGDKLETIVRMATELGVTRVIPVIAERTVARADVARAGIRLRRWQRIAKEAAKQSGRASIPEVRSPLRFVDWLREPREPGLLLCLWERATTPLDRVLPEPPVARATIVVGPEGGFTDQEVERARSSGAVVAGLGSRILRTETAAPVAVALLQSRYGDLGRAGGR